MKVLLSGNEAIAHGAYAAGVTIATGYPGTPSTEILEALSKYEEIDASWAPNEKVALEVGIGASLGGARALVSMKHVGLNVAADPLFTLAYTGVNGGLVIVSADDPGMHSSQNEQDNRYYAKFAKVPMLEPSDSEEAASLVGEAFKISENFDIPVIIRTTTRINHSKSLVDVDIERVVKETGYVKNAEKYVMIPANAKERRRLLESKLKALAEFSEGFSGNRVEWGSRHIGFITSGISYQYVKELYPDASVLKLTMTYPLPGHLISEFISQVGEAIVVEELEPYLEDQIKAWGLQVTGKRYIPNIGELSPDIIALGLGSKDNEVEPPGEDELPARPPMLCAGCPHRGVFYVLRRLKLIVTGDIGCYTLGVLPPLESMDTCICMGASIGSAMGLQKATGRKDVVAVIGDSTFVHSGVTPLIDIVYNRGVSTVIILDNRTTAMTGQQDHPGTGTTLKGAESRELNLEKLVEAIIGIESVRIADPYNLKAVKQVIKEEIEKEEPSVIIFKRACLLVEKSTAVPFAVNEKCNGCKVCLKLGCPAISWEDNKAVIEPSQCTGCEVCVQLCKKDAIAKYQ